MYGSWKDDQYGAPPMNRSKKDDQGVLSMSRSVVGVVEAMLDTMARTCGRTRVARVATRSNRVATTPVEVPVKAFTMIVERGGSATVWRHTAATVAAKALVAPKAASATKPTRAPATVAVKGRPTKGWR
jgi:hypothetical protein